MSRPWWLYMIECMGGGIYIGIAVDVAARYEKHSAGRGAVYTRINRPVRLLAKKAYPDHRSAAQAEYAMKQLTLLEKHRWALALSGNATDLRHQGTTGDASLPHPPDQTASGT